MTSTVGVASDSRACSWSRNRLSSCQDTLTAQFTPSLDYLCQPYHLSACLTPQLPPHSSTTQQPCASPVAQLFNLQLQYSLCLLLVCRPLLSTSDASSLLLHHRLSAFAAGLLLVLLKGSLKETGTQRLEEDILWVLYVFFLFVCFFAYDPLSIFLRQHFLILYLFLLYTSMWLLIQETPAICHRGRTGCICVCGDKQPIFFENRNTIVQSIRPCYFGCLNKKNIHVIRSQERMLLVPHTNYKVASCYYAPYWNEL